MNRNDIQDKLEDIKVENFVWIIYIGIIFLYIAIEDEDIDEELSFN